MSFSIVNNNNNNFSNYSNREEVESELLTMLFGASDTLDRWDDLLQQSALHHRIDLKTFTNLNKFVEDNRLSRKYFEQINQVKSRFLSLLIQSMQSLTAEADPDKVKADHLMAIASDCLEQENGSDAELSNAIEKLKGKFESKPFAVSIDFFKKFIYALNLPFSAPSLLNFSTTTLCLYLLSKFINKKSAQKISFFSHKASFERSLIPPSMPISTDRPCYIRDVPDDLTHLFMQYLNPKDLGRMAQVSETFKVFANNNNVWRRLCEQDSEVDLKNIENFNGNYKLLYQDETEIKKFLKGGIPYGFSCLTPQGKKQLIIKFNFGLIDLRGKHVYKILKNEIRKKPEIEVHQHESDELKIFVCGEPLKNDDNVYDQKWWVINTVYVKAYATCYEGFKARNTKDLIEDMLPAAIIEKGFEHVKDNSYISFYNDAYAQHHSRNGDKAVAGELHISVNPLQVEAAWKIMVPLIRESPLKIQGKINLCKGLDKTIGCPEGQQIVLKVLKSDEIAIETWKPLVSLIHSQLTLGGIDCDDRLPVDFSQQTWEPLIRGSRFVNYRKDT